MLVWFDFLPCPFCFPEELSAFVEERRMWFSFSSLWHYLSLSQSAASGRFVLWDEVPPLTVLCWVTASMTVPCTLNTVSHDRHTCSVFQSRVGHAEEGARSETEQLLICFFLTYQTHGTTLGQFVAQNHPRWIAGTCEQLQGAWSEGNCCFIDTVSWVNWKLFLLIS